MDSKSFASGRIPQRRHSNARTLKFNSAAFFLLSVLLVLVIMVITAHETEGGGIAWHTENDVTNRSYSVIAITDLENDSIVDVGGILKSPCASDPAVEFYSYQNEEWHLRSENISPGSIYNDLAIKGGLVVAGHQGGNSVDAWVYNTTTHTFVPEDPETVIQNYSLSIAIADLNKDGFPDIVAGYKSRGIKIFYGTEGGGWVKGTSPWTSDMVKDILVADLNNDSNPDIVNTLKIGSATPHGIEAWLGDGRGNWSHRTISSTGDYSTISCANLNGDGLPDIVTAGNGQGIYSFINNGGNDWQRREITTKGLYRAVMLRDIDGDGLQDVVGCRFDDGGVNIYRGKGDGNFTDVDYGPTNSGNFSYAAAYDFDGDGHMDMLAASEDGLHFWRQVLPEIKSVTIPSRMYPHQGPYNISVVVRSESLINDPASLESVKLRFLNNGTELFTLCYSGVSGGYFYLEKGTGIIRLNDANCSRENLSDGRVRVNFNVTFLRNIPDVSSDNGGEVFAFMSESRGSTGWVNLTGLQWGIISSIEVRDVNAVDSRLNPGMAGKVYGTVYYRDSSIPVPDDYILQVRLYMTGGTEPVGVSNTTTSGQFLVNLTLPDEDGDYTFWPKIYLNRTGVSVYSFPKSNVTIHADYVVVTDMWITNEAFFDFNSLSYWQAAGGPLTFHVHAEYNHSHLPFEGELKLTNGSAIYNTTERAVQLTFGADETHFVRLVPVNDSATHGAYGPMLRSNLTVVPTAVWDGESPVIEDFKEGSLQNGSEIKAVNATVSIIVNEKGFMDPNNRYGGIVLYWSIVQENNITINGSVNMSYVRDRDNYTFTGIIPLSLAEKDNVAYFYFNGSDSVGNPIVSYLYPVKYTKDDPAIVIVDPTPPSAPVGLYTNAGDGYVELRWRKNTERDVAGYRVYRSSDGIQFYLISGSHLVPYNYYKDDGVENGKTYYYRITAVDRAIIPNESNFSAVVTAKPVHKMTLQEEIESIIMGNLPLFFGLIVVLAIAGESSLIIRRSRKKAQAGNPEKTEKKEKSSKKKEKRKGSKKKENAGAKGKMMKCPRCGLFSAEEYCPRCGTHLWGKSTETPLSGSSPAFAPQPANQAQQTPANPYPPVTGICPNCKNSVTLGEGERLCPVCNYMIR